MAEKSVDGKVYTASADGKLKVDFAAAISSKSPGACVSVGIPFKLDGGVFRALAHGETPKSTTSLHESAVAVALVERVKEVLMSAKNVSKTKVSEVHCGYAGGEIVISASCAAQFGVVRRVTLMSLAALQPAKCSPGYAAALRSTNEPAKKEYFTHAANALARAVKGGVSVLISGKSGIQSAKLEDVAKRAKEKLKEVDLPTGESKAPSVNKFDPALCKDVSNMQALKLPDGIASYYVRDYLMKVIHSRPHQEGSQLFVPATEGKLAASDKKEKIDAYTASFSRGGRVIYMVHVYQAALKTCSSVSKLIVDAKKNPSAADIRKMISDVLP